MSYENLDNLMKQADGFAKQIAGLRPLANSELESYKDYLRIFGEKNHEKIPFPRKI